MATLNSTTLTARLDVLSTRMKLTSVTGRVKNDLALIYMEAGITNNTVHLWPVPESPAYDLILATPETFSAFADLDTKYPLQEPSRRATTTRSAPGSATRSACHLGSRPRR